MVGVRNFIKTGYVVNKGFQTAKPKPQRGGQAAAPNTYLNWNDKLKFDASFETDAPEISFSMDRFFDMFKFEQEEPLKKPKEKFSFGKKKGPPP